MSFAPPFSLRGRDSLANSLIEVGKYVIAVRNLAPATVRSGPGILLAWALRVGQYKVGRKANEAPIRVSEKSTDLSPKIIQTLFTYVSLIVGSFIFGTLVIITALLGDRSGTIWWPYLARNWARQLLYIGGATEVYTEGTEKLQTGTAAIVMCNHESHFDPPALMRSSPGTLLFLTKHSLFYFPIFGQAMWLMRYVPINRGKSAKAHKSIDRAAKLIASGRMILIFPEGTRSRSGEMLPFKKGGFVLAAKSGVPIIPAAIAGTREILPPGWSCRGRGPVVLLVGEPIDTSGYDMKSKDELMAKVEQEIISLRERAREIYREKTAA